MLHLPGFTQIAKKFSIFRGLDLVDSTATLQLPCTTMEVVKKNLFILTFPTCATPDVGLAQHALILIPASSHHRVQPSTTLTKRGKNPAASLIQRDL